MAKSSIKTSLKVYCPEDIVLSFFEVLCYAQRMTCSITRDFGSSLYSLAKEQREA
jgi:hypothetical protein